MDSFYHFQDDSGGVIGEPFPFKSTYKLTHPILFFILAVVVFNLNKTGNIAKAIKGERVGTLIGDTWNTEAVVS